MLLNGAVDPVTYVSQNRAWRDLVLLATNKLYGGGLSSFKNGVGGGGGVRCSCNFDEPVLADLILFNMPLSKETGTLSF